MPRLLKRGSESLNGILLFGNDEAGIATLAGSVVRGFQSDEEPLRMDASLLRSDPAALDDAFRSMSLLGGRRLIVLDGCEEAHVNALRPVIAADVPGNFVLMLAGSLNKSSKLRDAAQGSGNFGVLGVYEDSDADALVRIRRMFAATGLSADEDVLFHFASLVGHDRGLAAMEIEKLALYCMPETAVTLADVEASCGDGGGRDVDGLIEAVLDGNLEDADRSFEATREDGRWRQVLIMLQMYLARLETAAAAIEKGSSTETAFRSLRPPVYPAQQRMMGRQLRIFSLADLGRAQDTVQKAILQSREMAGLDEIVTARALMAIASAARQLRQRKLV